MLEMLVGYFLTRGLFLGKTGGATKAMEENCPRGDGGSLGKTEGSGSQKNKFFIELENHENRENVFSEKENYHPTREDR